MPVGRARLGEAPADGRRAPADRPIRRGALTDHWRSAHMSVTTQALRTVIAAAVALIACGHTHPARATHYRLPRGHRFATTHRAATPRRSAAPATASHIQAADLPSLGFGEGYAQAEDHLCTIADQVVRGRRAVGVLRARRGRSPPNERRRAQLCPGAHSCSTNASHDRGARVGQSSSQRDLDSAALLPIRKSQRDPAPGCKE